MVSGSVERPQSDAHEALPFPDAREHVPFALLELDERGGVRHGNAAAREQLGQPERGALAMLLGAAAAQEVLVRLDRAHREGAAPPWSTELVLPEGRVREAQLALTPLPSALGEPWRAQLGISVSTSPRPSPEPNPTHRAPRLGDRKAAVQTLAAGVAHEIGNPLTYMLMCMDELDRGLERSGQCTQLIPTLQQARQGAERVQEIVRGLSSYDRDHGRRERVDINNAVRRAFELARPELLPHVRIHTSLELVPAVRANPSRLQQVLYNLLVNAAHALDPAQPDAALGAETWVEGSWVYVNIWDTGPGIDPKIRDQIFEPFVSSKPAGHGAGLGLAVCHNYVAELEGEIDFDCEPGQGTRFTVRLPAEPTVARPTHSATARPSPATARLLVVEDEPEIRRGLQAMLKRFGQVDVAESAAEARALLGPEQHYDLVLCDLMMPGESGEELYGWITTARPDLAARVAYVTGGGPRLRPSSSGDTEIDGPPCLLKPFRRQELYEFVRRTMKVACGDQHSPAKP